MTMTMTKRIKVSQLPEFDALPCAWMALGACTGQPVFRTTPPDEPNVAGWEPLYRRIAHNP